MEKVRKLLQKSPSLVNEKLDSVFFFFFFFFFFDFFMEILLLCLRGIINDVSYLIFSSFFLFLFFFSFF